MTDKEALKLALEALTSGVDAQVGRVVWTEYDSCLINEAITAIKAALAQPAQERNFCSRCGKRTADLTTIHTCTPPQEKNNG
jgi:hypothetical protein